MHKLTTIEVLCVLKLKSLRNAFQGHMHIKIITQACEFPQIMHNRLQSTKQGFSPSVVSYLGGTMPDYITCMHTNQHHQRQHKKQTTTAAALD